MSKGGIKTIKIADDEVLTAPVTIQRSQLLKEGQALGDVDFFTDTLHDEQQVQTGYRIPVEVRARGMAAADVTTLVAKSESGTPQFVEFEMLSGNKVLYKNVQIRVGEKPVADFGKLAFTRIVFEATGVKRADVYSVVEFGGGGA